MDTMRDEVDFGWFQPTGMTGTRLTWDRATGILYLFHANSAVGSYDEPLAVVGDAQARRIGERWLTMSDPIAWVREQTR